MNKEKVLGRAQKRRYDLPLNKGAGTGFLVLLVALMTFLGMMALSSAFALSAMTHRWSSGLENSLTVEIPAQGADGKILDRKAMASLSQNIATTLQGIPGIKSVHALSDKEISKLVEPWLGQDIAAADFPVPGMVAVQTTKTDTDILQTIRAKTDSIAPNVRLDTHEQWLDDLLRFTGALQFAALILACVIGLTMVTAVSGAVRARMAVHRAEVELLHLMGASDGYITRQFQRHSLILALRGGVAGTVAGAVILALIGAVAGRMDVDILPGFRLETGQMILLACVPLAVAGIATLSTRTTVVRALESFP